MIAITNTGRMLRVGSEAEAFRACDPGEWPVYSGEEDEDQPVVAAALARERDAALLADPSRCERKDLPRLAALLVEHGRSEDLAVELVRRGDVVRDALPENPKDPIRKAVRTMAGALVREQEATVTEPEILPIWKRYSLRRVAGRYTWLAASIVAFVTCGGLGAIAWDLSQGGTARPPNDVGGLATDWTICPSPSFVEVPVRVEPWLAVGPVLTAHGLPTAYVEGPCHGPPGATEIQVRHYGDVVEGFEYQLSDDKRAAFVSDGQIPIRRGIIYVDPAKISACTPSHESVHAHGIGVTIDGEDHHASAGIMARDCTLSQDWRLVDLVIAARSADTDGPLP